MSDPLNHLVSIWYYSEPLEVPYSPNQFLGWDFFCSFLQQTGSSQIMKVKMNNQDETLNRAWFHCVMYAQWIHLVIYSYFKPHQCHKIFEILKKKSFPNKHPCSTYKMQKKPFVIQTKAKTRSQFQQHLILHTTFPERFSPHNCQRCSSNAPFDDITTILINMCL